MSTAPHECQECANAISKPAIGKFFCSSSCRQTFNNRRMQRGAEIYDLFRAMRRERSEAKSLNIWTKICQLELAWQQEDDAQRPGRRSYFPPKKALTNLLDKGSLPRGDVLSSAYRVGR